METLDNLIEKVLTLNVNANTNIDVQAIIEKYVLYTQASKVIIAVIICLTIIIIACLVYKSWLKSFKIAEISCAIDKVIEKMEKINEYDFTSRVKDSLKEILEYMPRNKNRRKTDRSD